MTNTKTLSEADLIQFTGSEHWYRHAMVRDILYTDGVKYVAETGGAYWLLDEIALAQRFDKLIAAEESQLWKLKVNSDHTATLVCEDGDCRSVFTKAIEYTDFPLAEISLYFINNTILLAERILIGSVGLAAVTRPFPLLRRAGAVEASKCGLDLKRNAGSTQLMTEGHVSDDFGWRRWRGARGSGR